MTVDGFCVANGALLIWGPSRFSAGPGTLQRFGTVGTVGSGVACGSASWSFSGPGAAGVVGTDGIVETGDVVAAELSYAEYCASSGSGAAGRVGAVGTGISVCSRSCCWRRNVSNFLRSMGESFRGRENEEEREVVPAGAWYEGAIGCPGWWLEDER